ncbi:MAG: ribonuclease PH [Candidatus Wallbacteria bacterium HGW-Wallbacteria-1]|jgi:ribonuclease PH|uniref:Ribonuclease PH n=1 Tax=Candidatus Wallbacteria bacterium HGW-Wallbacteria-1 TaxID=2013854 RepID=A0A2N1PUJ9_9BACT|nr:MAG: ribonuclease PH [Candidatus Wallbacteria bacterium HGW-Wallbacteria-1]
MPRIDGRSNDQLRQVQFIRNYIIHPEGSVLACMGNTKVLCNVSITEGVPAFLEGKNQGWLDAEYGMLPRSTNTRNSRERHGLSGRSTEIQRLIGRALRACLDLKKVGQNTILVDCDVLQADGGTRTCAISGAFVALKDAIARFMEKGLIKEDPITCFVAAISVGIHDGEVLLDLKYEEDCVAEVDSNFVINDREEIFEVQGTAEHGTFDKKALDAMYDIALKGIKDLIQEQKKALQL